MEEVYSREILDRIGKEFVRKSEVCYLDHAGATLYSELQMKNILQDLCENVYGNPHSHSITSKLTSDRIDQVRQRLLQFFDAENEYSLVFTSGATQAIKILVENFDFGENGAYVYTQSNHTSIVGARETPGVPFHCVPVADYENMFANKLGHDEIDLASGNSLFAYPAECNLSGEKFPLSWISKIQNGDLSKKHNPGKLTKWFCLLDAACFCSTNRLDLSVWKPDFVCVSFYKIFGYPTGLGALLIRNASSNVLRKRTYFGGGTVEVYLACDDYFVERRTLHERFEDGTIPYLSIIALDHGLNTFTRLGINMDLISKHVSWLSRQVIERMNSLRHWNGTQVARIYTRNESSDLRSTQGGIVNFNLIRSDGSIVGYSEVQQLANLSKIQLRTGCFCNSGACQYYLKSSNEDLISHFHAGHVCGDEVDLINGQPTGSVRISFGYMSTSHEVEQFLEMIEKYFVEKNVKTIARTREMRLDQRPGIKLKRICLYPVKSCGGLVVNSWNLNEKGLQYDRQWMVVNKNGVCLTQKQETRLCLIKPCIDLEQKVLKLAIANDDEQVVLPLQHTTEKLQNPEEINLCKTKICKDYVRSYDCGDTAARWLSRVLNREGLRLVRQSDDDEGRKSRSAEVGEETKLSLTNQAQFLLINTASVKWLKDQLGLDDLFSLDNLIARFRANLVVENHVEFSENNWGSLSVGDVEFKVDGPCTRCQMICIDQETGYTSKEPLQTLSAALCGKIKFGIYLTRVGKTTNQVINVENNLLVN